MRKTAVGRESVSVRVSGVETRRAAPFRVEIVQGGMPLENRSLDAAPRVVYSFGLWEGPISIGNVGPRDMFVALLKREHLLQANMVYVAIIHDEGSPAKYGRGPF